jgi:molybdopterin-containing oxidoreductase family membrane subunit
MHTKTLSIRSFQVAWLILFLFGLTSVILRLLTGKEIANYGGYVPWGLWVAVYLFFVGMAAGSFFLGSAAIVFRIRVIQPLIRPALVASLASLLGGLMAIFLDLGRPFRAWKVLLQPNFSSMMAWMIWMYTAFVVLLVLMLWLVFRREQFQAQTETWLPRLAVVGLPLAIAFSGGVGALFGVIGARPYWNTSTFPLMFLSGALLTGTALVTLLSTALYPNRETATFRHLVPFLGNLLLACLALQALVEWAEFSIAYYASIPSHVGPWEAILFGPYWWVFWIVHLGFGMVLPAALLLSRSGRSSPARVLTAALLVVITFLSVRLNVVIPGLVHAELKGLKNAYQDLRLHFDYFPSLLEFGVAAFCYALVAGLLAWAHLRLPLWQTPSSSEVSS